jgi:hypothetical protein
MKQFKLVLGNDADQSDIEETAVEIVKVVQKI